MQLGDFDRHWTPPDSLGYSSLRPVRLTGLGKTAVVIAVTLVIGAVVLGVFLAGVARRKTEEQRLLRSEGLPADATVTRAWLDSDKERQPLIAYRFDYAGRAYTNRVETPRKIWPSLSKGSTIQVRFVPSRPSISHPVAWNAPAFPIWLAYLVAGMIAALSLLPTIPVRCQARLLTEGRPAPGRVTGFRKGGKDIEVQYEFRLLSGAIAKGRTNAFKPPVEGSPVCVLYDPENPRRNALYPLSLVHLENAPSRAR
jgi:hypothetical protein